jgi:non-heme chloroperoxidase
MQGARIYRDLPIGRVARAVGSPKAALREHLICPVTGAIICRDESFDSIPPRRQFLIGGTSLIIAGMFPPLDNATTVTTTSNDRRGHGRSTQTADGHDMDHYADDLAAVTAHLALKDAIHVGHSTGGGEVVRYLARHGESRVAKAVLISSVPPLMVKTIENPGGLPKEVFDGFQAQVANNRAQFYREVAAGPFYGYNRPGAKAAEGIIQNWWRQGMEGGAKAHYDGIVAFSQTDLTADLKKISVPTLVMHGDDDQIVPYADSGPLSAKLLKNGTLKTYKGFPHGMPTTEAATINKDLLAFIQS